MRKIQLFDDVYDYFCYGRELDFIPMLGMVINPWVEIEICITKIPIMGCTTASYILYHVLTCFDRGTQGHDWPLD